MPVQARREVLQLGASKIREVANTGIGREDVLPFWFGEPDAVTPEFIREAGIAALRAGETFYTSNLGIPALRESLSRYLSGLHGPVDVDRIAVTSSGVSALMIAGQTLFSPGDRVVVVTPVWPNLTEGPRILGAEVVRVGLDCEAGHWQLDLQRLLDALTPKTRALVVNSPNNPTGWVIEREQQLAIIERCRRLGIWIIADDVYERLIYEPTGSGPRCAASFLDVCSPEDRIISTNSFSKSWLMTGWRLGWLVSPRGADGATLLGEFGKLIEYNTSCAPGFVQSAAVVAIEQGAAIIEQTARRYQVARDYLCDRLAQLPQTAIARPQGAMYLFFKLDSELDSLTLCKRLVVEAGLGLAPGSAFGAEGEGYVRWCIASSIERLEAGVKRLEAFLANSRERSAA
jgi:aspartate/methionine/tyrosine aminotransferase